MHGKFVDICIPPTTRETSRWPQRLRGFEEANSGDLLYTQITSSPSPYLPTFLPFILSFEWAIFLFALPPFTSDKLLCKFVECTQAEDLNEVSLFCSLKGALLSFFFSFGYEQGKKRPSWRSDKSLSVKQTQKDEEIKGQNPETIFDSDSPTVHTTKERYGLCDLVKGKAGVSVHPNYYMRKKAFERTHAFYIYLVCW